MESKDPEDHTDVLDPRDSPVRLDSEVNEEELVVQELQERPEPTAKMVCQVPQDLEEVKDPQELWDNPAKEETQETTELLDSQVCKEQLVRPVLKVLVVRPVQSVPWELQV